MAALTACSKRQSSLKDIPEDYVPKSVVSKDSEARIECPRVVDMGVFDYKTPVKSTTIEFSNNGDAPLYINAVVAECECTKILSVDSIVQPQGKGNIVVSLDLSEYLTDTIYKAIHIISSDRERHNLPIELKADCRM